MSNFGMVNSQYGGINSNLFLHALNGFLEFLIIDQVVLVNWLQVGTTRHWAPAIDVQKTFSAFT